ncbi:FAD-dependent oxidoreductase [bacterium]|nr:FAD-dependent oxidoreductase [bacterium]
MSEQNPAPVPGRPPLSVSRISTEVNRTGSWKYTMPVYHDRVAPCSAGCPTGVDIQGYMTLLRAHRIPEALELLLRENPMPAITGRVCNHPCENLCNRCSFDGAVSIHAVERMLGDQELMSPLPQPAARLHTERIAVIGSGPAGLACAYHLVRLGYRAEVFEQELEAGGMLRQGIPQYRLPREVLDRQLERYEALGVVFHTGTRAGGDLDWLQLQRDFAAIFIASGAQISKVLQLDGAEDSPALLSGLDFLRAVNRGERPSLGHHVLVIGGGNTAMDCARVALRLGSQVTVVYRRGREEMPAISEEVDDAEREGVEFQFLAAPERLVHSEGRLRLYCRSMKLVEADASGRRRFEDSGEPSFALPADTILTAIGEDAELQVLPAEIREDRGVDDWGATGRASFFLGGDVAGDERTVASALGAGKRAAIGIDRYLRSLRGEALPEPTAVELRLGGHGSFSSVRWTGEDPVARVDPINTVVTPEDVNTSDFAHEKRHEDRHLELLQGFEESNAGISMADAMAEAARCFQCGVCNDCELCRIYCSEAAITRDPVSGRLIIDLDHCKGCGVCAEECPRGAISMERLGAAL